MLASKVLMLRRSLQWRLMFIIVLIVIALMAFISVPLYYFVQSSYYQTFNQRIKKGFEDWGISNAPTQQEIIRYLKNEKNAIYLFLVSDYKTYTIFDKNTNQIIYSSEKMFERDNNKLLNEIFESRNFLAALSGKIGDNESLVRYGDKSYFDYAENKGDFLLYFRYDSEEWVGTINKLNRVIWLTFLIAAAASLVLGFMLSRAITIPIVNLMHKARKLAAGDFGQVLEVKSDDEIGKLTKAFNFMSRELKNTLTQISSEKNKIETVLNYMTDGVVAFNQKGEIIHANPAAKSILEIKDEKLDFTRMSQEYNFGITLEEAFSPDFLGGKEANLSIGDRCIRAYFAVFADKAKTIEGIISVFQDVTERQKLENARKEFVANVSHELRTPLTSIKSYAETLMEGQIEDAETAHRFLGVINSEADRMTRLVKDLLQLSRLDSGMMQFRLCETSIDDLVKETVEKMAMSLRSKNLRIEVNSSNLLPTIEADKDRIEQVIVNIISNSIKYTQTGGKITVQMWSDDHKIYIKIIDTGIGIPEKDLPRIFERFYRVDKARSREAGGTGLGLSIAKQILEAHGGEISIYSEFMKGTSVTVALPLCNLNLRAM